MSILSTALLLTAALAAVAAPGAAQEIPGGPFPEPEPCPHRDWFSQAHVRITQRGDCNLDVVVFEHIICVGGWGGKVEQTVAGQRVFVYYCDGGLGDRIQDLIGPAAIEPVPCDALVAGGVPGVLTVDVDSSCHVTVTVNEGIHCVGPWIDRHEKTVGPVTVVEYRCGHPSGPPASTTAASQDPWCTVADATPPPLQSQWTRDQSGCYTYVEPWQCLGGNGIPIERRVGPVHALILVCTPPPGSVPVIQ